jgi:hypothetical protein
MKNDKELYAELKKRAEIVKNKILERNGQRSIYIQQLKAKGFNKVAEVEAYIEQAKKEQAEKQLIIKEKLAKYANAIQEAERLLGE